MIYIGRAKEMNQSNYDECWLIVRSPDEILDYAKHIPALSPSPELFRKYRTALKEGVFNKKWFDEVYVPRFLLDISRNRESIDTLEELIDIGKDKDIFLACYCEEESICHRSIVGGILLGMGAPIITDSSYIKYFNML